MSDFFSDYQVGDFFDEMFAGPGVVRPHYSKLFARFKEMEREGSREAVSEALQASHTSGGGCT